MKSIKGSTDQPQMVQSAFLFNYVDGIKYGTAYVSSIHHLKRNSKNDHMLRKIKTWFKIDILTISRWC